MKTSIEIDNISKEFKSYEIKNFKFTVNKTTVLENINLKINSGEIFGLMGPNGSGKTTLLKSISGLLLPDNGEIRFKNDKNMLCTPKIGYVNSNFRSFYWRLTGRQNLKFFCSLLGIKNTEVNELLNDFSSFFNIEDKMDRKFMFYSSGEMQYFSIIRALINNPNVLLLDEPCSNIDSISAQRVVDFFINYLSSERITVIWCSHNIQEIHNVCNKYGILNKGKLVSVNDIKNIDSKLFKNYIFGIFSNDRSKLSNTNLKFKLLERNDNILKICFSSENISLSDGLQRIIRSKIQILSISLIEETSDIENNLKKFI